MNFKFDYHKSLDVLHFGCEKPRAYFVPCKTASAAKSRLRADSELFTSLCGDWDFKYFGSERELPDFISSDFTIHYMLPLFLLS